MRELRLCLRVFTISPIVGDNSFLDPKSDRAANAQNIWNLKAPNAQQRLVGISSQLSSARSLTYRRRLRRWRGSSWGRWQGSRMELHAVGRTWRRDRIRLTWTKTVIFLYMPAHDKLREHQLEQACRFAVLKGKRELKAAASIMCVFHHRFFFLHMLNTS